MVDTDQLQHNCSSCQIYTRRSLGTVSIRASVTDLHKTIITTPISTIEVSIITCKTRRVHQETIPAYICALIVNVLCLFFAIAFTQRIHQHSFIGITKSTFVSSVGIFHVQNTAGNGGDALAIKKNIVVETYTAAIDGMLLVLGHVTLKTALLTGVADSKINAARDNATVISNNPAR